MANYSQMVRDSVMVTTVSLLETIIALSNGIIADPIRPPLPPECHGPKCTPKTRCVTCEIY